MKVAAFDLDGTLLPGNSSFSFCRYLQRHGILTAFDLVYCSAIYAAHLFFGLSVWTLHTCVFKKLFRGKRVEELSIHIQPFLKTLIWYEPACARLNQLRSEGADIYIFSNSPAFLVKPIAASIGVDQVFATDYKIDKAGCLWDIASLVDGEQKGRILRGMGRETSAYSDSHHDLPFLESASKAVVVNPTRRLSKMARKRKWEMI